ncbi:MAG: hypothetical protein ACOCVA_08760 [Prolixibacteraceae bacterium]
MAESKKTTNHEFIKKWAEERNGKPAIVKGTEENQPAPGLLRIKFSEESGDNLKTISWDEFFKTFEDKNLQFLYEDDDNKENRFFKFVQG